MAPDSKKIEDSGSKKDSNAQNKNVLTDNLKEKSKLKVSYLSTTNVQETDIWVVFVRRHVELARTLVYKTFIERTFSETQSLVLEYLDGYLTWLHESPRKLFVEKFLASTTYPPDQNIHKNTKKRVTEFIPSSREEAINNLNVYITLWRTLFTLTETMSHCYKRLAQIYDWEIENKGPVYQLCRDITSPVKITELDIALFYQYGIQDVENRKANFDDINECSTQRISSKYNSATESTPRVKHKLRKTFYEPEGLCAFVVALRNYFSIVSFNAFLTLVAWYWYSLDGIGFSYILLADGVCSVISSFLEFFSRSAVYSCREGWRCTMPIVLTFIQLIIYAVGFGEIGLWYLSSYMSILPKNIKNLIILSAVGGSVLLRIMYNMILFLRFPALGTAHYKKKHTTCGSKNKMMIRTVVFFICSTGVLIPLNYWFVVPTLERSAFWTFCGNSQNLITTVQCYIGIAGLWIPLLSIILIMNFISYSCIMAFYGAYLALSNKVGYSTDEAFSVIAGFRSFSALLQKWMILSPRGNKSISFDELKSRWPKTESKEIDNLSTKKSDRFRAIFTTVIDPDQIENEIELMYSIWYLIVDDLYDMDLISKNVAQHLYVAFNWQDIDLGSRPKEIIQFFFSTVVSLSGHELNHLAEHFNYLDRLPSVTQLIPSYGEAVVFDSAYLCNRDKKKVSNLEFIILKYPKEWENFYNRMCLWFSDNQGVIPGSADELAALYVQNNGKNMDPTIQDEIRLWASLRGQSLYKTIRGTLSYRTALRNLYRVTKRREDIIPYRTQVVLAHQQYGDPSVLKMIAKDIYLVYKKLSSPRVLGLQYGDSPFDLVFDWNPRELAAQKTFLMKLAQQQNEETIKRYTLKTIHEELEDVCAHGEMLKKLIDAKSINCPIDPKGYFPYASVMAGLPKATRIVGRSWLFISKGSIPNEFRKRGEADDYEADQYNDQDRNSNDGLSNSTSSISDSILNVTKVQDKRKKNENYKWRYLAYGCAVVHSESSIGECALLRFFHNETGREYDYIIRDHLFEVKPLVIFQINDDSMVEGNSMDNKSKSKYYSVIKFAIKNGSRAEAYALVTCISDNYENTVSESSRVMRNTVIMDNTKVVLKEMEDRNTEEINCLMRALTHPRRYVRTDINSDMELGKLPLEKNKMYMSAIRALDVLSEFSQEGCISRDSVPAIQDNIYLGIEVRTVLPRRNSLILRVRGELPFAESDRIQGKASNQLNGLRFSFGLVIQTKDANQGGNIAEALKYPIILSRFNIHEARIEKKTRSLAPTIIGFRENVFTLSHGTVARFQAYAEWAFVTIVQRVFSKLGIRMHYGHPDFFDGAWVFSRNAISKANPVYNLSEDIFAGYVALLNNRRSVHTDEIQDEKGRDTSLASTYTFTAKLAQGAASQMKTRDVFNLNTRLDFIRQFLLFNSSLGYYFTTTAMLVSVKLYLFGLFVFSLTGYSAENLGNLEFIYSVPFLVQVGMFTLLPLVLETAVEKGFWDVIQVIVDLPLSLAYYLFQGQTTTHHLSESFIKGKSHYEATGRLLGLSRKPLVEVYQLYGKSHFEPALDYLFYVVAYYVVTATRHGGYLPLFAPIICILVFILAPSMFQVSGGLKIMFNDVSMFGRWIFSSESFPILLKEWKNGPLREQVIKNLTWKATFKVSHTRLQTYSIFGYLKNVINTHWRVDLFAALYHVLKTVIWMFIVISIPGGMKDSVTKVLVGAILYILLTISTSVTNTHKKRGFWHGIANMLFVFGIFYFLVLFVKLQAWKYINFCVVGIFLSIKVIRSFSWFVFHMYAWKKKVFSARRWRYLEQRAAAKKLMPEERDKKFKEIKSDLERSLLAGLYLLDIVDRPFILLSLTLVFLPIHILFNLLWCIPRVSDFLLYSIALKSRLHYKTENVYLPSDPWGNGGGYNAFAAASEMDELPEFDFEDDAEIIYSTF